MIITHSYVWLAIIFMNCFCYIMKYSFKFQDKIFMNYLLQAKFQFVGKSLRDKILRTLLIGYYQTSVLHF